MKKTFKIGYLPILDHLILGVAKEKDEGTLRHLSIETELFSNWDDIDVAMRNKQIDGAFLLFPLALEGFRQNKNTKLVLLGHREGQVLVTQKSVHNLAQLKNKTILLPHKFSTHNILLYKILQSAKLDLDDVVCETVSEDIRAATEQLGAGTINAFVLAEPLGTKAQKLQIGDILRLSHDIEAHHIDCVLVLSQDLVLERAEACEELVRSLVRAGMFINAYPRQAAEIGEDFLGWPKKILLEALTHDKGHILFWDLLPRMEDFEILQDIAVDELGLWKDKIDLSEFVYPDFAGRAYREWMIDLRKEVKDKGIDRTLPGSFGESISRFSKIFPDSQVVGLKYTKPGEKYPKEIQKVKEIKEIFSVFIEKVFDGQEFLVGSMSKTKKAFSFLQPSRGITPDRVLFKLSTEQAGHCFRAIHFGGQAPNFSSFQDNTAEGSLITPKEEIVMLQKGDEVWCSFGYSTFRFLVLLLNYFK